MQERPQPMFSLITVVRNSVETIEECIASVRKQSFRDFEYIVIDGLSDDGTSELILKNSDAVDIYVREKDSGIYDAMNKGITLCRGKYIGIINSDDAYFPDTLKIVNDVITSNPSAQIVYGEVEIISESGEILSVDHSELSQRMIAHPSCFVSAELFENFGVFNSELKIAADYDLMLRFREAGAKFKNSGKVLAKYRPGGASAKLRLTSIREMISIQARHLGWNWAYRNYRLARYAAATFVKSSNRGT